MATLPALPAGASCDSWPGAKSIDAVAVAQTTGPNGRFVLPNAPSTDVAPGAPIPLVVQTGKWRRETVLSSVPKCVSSPVAAESSRLPRNMFDGYGTQADIPKIAIAAGAPDALQ